MPRDFVYTIGLQDYLSRISEWISKLQVPFESLGNAGILYLSTKISLLYMNYETTQLGFTYPRELVSCICPRVLLNYALPIHKY